MKYTEHFVRQIATSKFVEQIGKGIVQIDNSEYITWDGCFAMGLYNGGLKRVSARSRSPLAFGGAVHQGLDTFLRYFGKMDYGELVGLSMNKAMADAAVTKLDALGDPKRNTNKLQNILESYFLEYSRVPHMQFDILELDGNRVVEQSFTVPLGKVVVHTKTWGTVEIEIIWMGKIDALTRFEGAISPADHKTTTVMGEKFVDDKVRSSQFLGYTFAARWLSQHLFDGKPIYGCRINALAMRATGFEFKIFDIPYPDWKVAEWQAETIRAIGELITSVDNFLQTGTVVPTREHCVTKYGKCSYFDVCDAHPTMRDRIIFDDSYFFVTDWSPLNE